MKLGLNHRTAFQDRLGRLFYELCQALAALGVDRVRKRHGAIRADTLDVLANAGKERAVKCFIADYRFLAVRLFRVQWRQFFEVGAR